MSEYQEKNLEKVPTEKKWYEKDTDDWDEYDEHEAMCDLFDTHH